MAVSRTEDRLALVNENELMVYSAQGALLWIRALPAEFKTSTVLFNPQNNNLLVYGSDNRVDENLYCFNATGKIIWQKKIAEGGGWSHLRPTVVKLLPAPGVITKKTLVRSCFTTRAGPSSPAGN